MKAHATENDFDQMRLAPFARNILIKEATGSPKNRRARAGEGGGKLLPIDNKLN